MVDAAESGLALATSVHRRLRQDILTGRLLPGLKLKPRDFADRYATGASPMREALSRLAERGLVERFEHRGFREAEAKPSQLAGLIRSRLLAAGAALRDAIRHGDVRWEEEVVWRDIDG
ncbi:GntR family transcriptional regulator [Pseudoroseomonas globiformis]|uniref:GntR family transcriptional regulator n=1 Tax=Teichococcus globiformis TaxID=2307229 RepID=A0ABV7FYN4_9PROT